MIKKNILKLTFGLAASAVVLLAAIPAGAQTADIHLRGVWELTRGPVDCATGQPAGPAAFPALMSFQAGGTVTGQAITPVTANAYGPVEFGVWRREAGTNNASFRLVSYTYDDNKAFTGRRIVTGDLTLTGANSFTYTATIEIFDASGNLLVSQCGASSGTRFTLNP